MFSAAKKLSFSMENEIPPIFGKKSEKKISGPPNFHRLYLETFFGCKTKFRNYIITKLKFGVYVKLPQLCASYRNCQNKIWIIYPTLQHLSHGDYPTLYITPYPNHSYVHMFSNLPGKGNCHLMICPPLCEEYS